MSEENTTSVENNNNDVDCIDKGAFILEKNNFSGKQAGFSFYTVVFKNSTEDEARASIDNALQRYNPKQLVSLLNSSIKSALRAKANAELPRFDSKEKEQAAWAKALDENPILVTPETAESYQPGTRELTVNGMVRKAMELIKEGKFAEGQLLLQEAQDQLKKDMEEEAAANS